MGSNVTYDVTHLYDRIHPSICEVYFQVSNPKDWHSEQIDSHYDVTIENTYYLTNKIVFSGRIRRTLVGYFLLSRYPGDGLIQESEVKEALTKIVGSITNSLNNMKLQKDVTIESKVELRENNPHLRERRSRRAILGETTAGPTTPGTEITTSPPLNETTTIETTAEPTTPGTEITTSLPLNETTTIEPTTPGSDITTSPPLNETTTIETTAEPTTPGSDITTSLPFNETTTIETTAELTTPGSDITTSLPFNETTTIGEQKHQVFYMI
uniref:cell wall protein RTB1-like n=1 Tax=Ciona intestinalis TaxID=7719 RepID=UPI000EF4AD73